jgi:flagellum-specific peptidoglycan hydrolase FlgJ
MKKQEKENLIIIGSIVGLGILLLFRKKIEESAKAVIYSAKDFVQKIKPMIERIRPQYNSGFVISVAALESNYGNSKLAKEGNNLFGITGESWAKQGKPVVYMDTKEYSDTRGWYITKRPFRKYGSWEESIQDFFNLLENNTRYQRVIQTLKGININDFAEAMWLSGYAKDPEYKDKIIARYNAIKGYL